MICCLNKGSSHSKMYLSTSTLFLALCSLNKQLYLNMFLNTFIRNSLHVIFSFLQLFFFNKFVMLSPYLIIPYEENATTVYSFFVYYSKPMYHKSYELNGIYLVCMCVCVCVCVYMCRPQNNFKCHSSEFRSHLPCLLRKILGLGWMAKKP